MTAPLTSSPVISPNANKTVDHVDYTKTHPTAERVSGIATNTGISIGIGLATKNPTASALAYGAAELLDVKGSAERVARNLTADQTIHYTDKSKDVIENTFTSTTTTSFSSSGEPTRKLQIRNGTQIHTQYINGKLASTTYYPAQGGIHVFGADGRSKDLNTCNIM
jgi:hypothetical protein